MSESNGKGHPGPPTTAAGPTPEQAKPTRRRRFRTLSRIAFMLYVCRVPVLLCVAIFLLGWRVEQIHEVVRMHLVNLDDPLTSSTSALNLFAIYLTLFLLTWSVLFWTRYCLVNRFPTALAYNALLRATVRALPAILAALPWLGGGLALYAANDGLPRPIHLIAIALGIAIAIIGPMSIVTYYTSPRNPGLRGRATAGAGAFTRVDLLFLSLLLSAGLFLLALFDPWRMGAWFGTIGVLLSAALAVLPFLAWLTASPRVPRWHWLSILFGVALCLSTFDLNDNHAIRELGERKGSVHAPDFGASFEGWLNARAPSETNEPYPVVLVAAEGGGIRAAYFTAQVLAAIQDQCPAFARHLFVISGVSGGSVGAAIFAGLLDADRGRSPAPAMCDPQATPSARLTTRVEDILKADFLAPIAAYLLYPDALQRILPFPIDAWDRARALELSVERSFTEVTGTHFMERSLYSYWRPEHDLPLLLFNTTQVSTGARVVAAPVQFLDPRFNRLGSLHEHDSRVDVRISTAAVMSARFPLVTPAASLVNGAMKFRYVDGGYFDNSGAVTLSEVLAVTLLEAARMKRSIRPVVIRIGNSPNPIAWTPTRPVRPDGEPPPMGLGELLSPVRTLVNTRSVSGALAAQNLETAVMSLWEEGRLADFIEFQIGVGEVHTPLGWQLSPLARNALRDQLTRPKQCDLREGIVSGCGIGDLIEAIGASAH